MRELVFGRYKIDVKTAKTLEDYARRGPHFLKCSCPGCQNFFISIKPYKDELSAMLAPLGISWYKPDEIKVLAARNERITYEISYCFYGRLAAAPKLWNTEETSLGTINVINTEAENILNECMKYVFLRRGKKLYVVVRAVLPWKMETLCCIYDDVQTETAKRLPGRAERIYSAAKYVFKRLKSAE